MATLAPLLALLRGVGCAPLNGRTPSGGDSVELSPLAFLHRPARTGELERKGTEADLGTLGSLHETGAVIDQQVEKLKEQRIYLEQALNSLKLIKLT